MEANVGLRLTHSSRIGYGPNLWTSAASDNELEHRKTYRVRRIEFRVRFGDWLQHGGLETYPHGV
jgi:hypothetical protein